ncbi:MAG: 7TM-DISM domain-containing protein, partial [Salinivirgaceae bacterium]
MKYFLVMLVLIISLSNLFSQGEVIITETNKSNPHKLSGNIFYLIDTTNDLTITQVMSSGFDNKFTQAGKSKFYYKGGYYSQWYKLSIRNLTSETQELVLSIDNPLVGDITFFSTLDADFNFSTGIQHPWNERLYSFKNYLFPIQLLPNESSTYVFKIAQQKFPTYVPISLNPKDYMQVKLSNYSFFYGIIISIMVFFTVLMLVLWWYEKSHSFIILLLLLFSIIVYNLWREGIFYQYLFSNNPTFNLSFGSFLIPLEILLLTLFVRFHFKIGKSREKIKNAFTIALILGIGFTFLQLMIHDYTFFLVGTQVMLLAFIAFSIISFVISSNTKNSYQNQFVILVLALYIDLICRIFLPFGIKGFSLLDIQLSALFMVGFFIITLSIFITRFNRSKVEILDMKTNLEYLVEKRT